MVALDTTQQLRVPLLHCEIGITRNLFFELMRDVINQHIENYALGEQIIRESIPALQQVIASTATQRDQWDNSDSENCLKTVKHTVAAYHKSIVSWHNMMG